MEAGNDIFYVFLWPHSQGDPGRVEFCSRLPYQCFKSVAMTAVAAL